MGGADIQRSKELTLTAFLYILQIRRYLHTRLRIIPSLLDAALKGPFRRWRAAYSCLHPKSY